MLRVAVAPKMLRWAIKRSRVDRADLEQRFPHLGAWIQKESQPTLKQLERFARATYTPVGLLLQSEPIDDELPIPDFRTVANQDVGKPSPNLLETIFHCQVRQDWYRDYALASGTRPLPFVGALKVGSDVRRAAERIRDALGFDLEERRKARSWTDANRLFVAQAEGLGILVMVSGIVGSNTHRTLDPEEFRGFALVDPVAPLVFVNGADTVAARMFTLAHELAHIWAGETALSDAFVAQAPKQSVELWCNQVAAELLVPLASLAATFDRSAALGDELSRLAVRFKVSTLVVLRRVLDAGLIAKGAYWEAFEHELARLEALKTDSKGGSFYRTQPARLSRRFTTALIADTIEGNTLFRDAYRMLGISKESTFRELGAQLGVL
jgi:Zn-dependent peptidase ImmA (M78 family)